MLGDVEVQDPSTVMTNDEETVQHAERDCRDGEEVHRRNGFPVISQKREPTSGWLRVSRCVFHPAGDRSLRNIETQHEKLAVDARCSPGRILRDHPEDQIPNFL